MLAAIGVPGHAVLVKPNRWRQEAESAAPMPIAKGLRDADAIRGAIERMAGLSTDGIARLEADLRAHMNPTRQRVIASLGERLRERLSTPCPACEAPGFGLVATEAGLPCELCDAPTDLARAEVHGCGACGCRVTRPRTDGRTRADAGHCPECNP